MKRHIIHGCLFGSMLVFMAWSFYQPKERFTWLMEVFPAIIGSAILAATYRRFKFTTLTYTLAWMFSLILIAGGHWTYAEVPLGNWARDAFHLSRNHFDRLGHLFQGIVPAMLGRELLLRTSPLRPGKWMFFICVSIAMCISASYELFEYMYAVLSGGAKAAESFLGGQGDNWDTQNDMLMALIGSIFAMTFLTRWQDRQIREMVGSTNKA